MSAPDNDAAAPGGEDMAGGDDFGLGVEFTAEFPDGPGWEQSQDRGGGRGVGSASPDPYEIAVPDSLRKTYAVDPGDPLSSWVRTHAKGTGMVPEQFRKLTSGYLETMVRQADAAHAQEYAALESEWGANCERQLGELTLWARAAANDREEFAAVKRLTTTAAGVRFLARLREREFQSGGSATMATYDDDDRSFDEQVRELMRSPEYRRGASTSAPASGGCSSSATPAKC